MCVSCVLYRILAFCLRLRSKCKYEAPQIITVSFIVLTLDVLYIICRPIFFNSGWYKDFFYYWLDFINSRSKCDIYTTFNTLPEYISLFNRWSWKSQHNAMNETFPVHQNLFNVLLSACHVSKSAIHNSTCWWNAIWPHSWHFTTID